jgi:7-cyano-7-deazaguanine synthase in queuosine biosynthesis
MKKILIMFSGGVESTALLQHALDQEHETTLVHVVHNNNTYKELSACKGIVSYTPAVKLHSVELRKDSFDDAFQKQYRDVAIWLGVAIAIVARGDFDEVWYGNHNKDNVSKVPKMETAWYQMMEILELTTLLVSPLRIKSKLDQYQMLTPEVKQCIVSCKAIPKGAWNDPCGKCIKCQEFKQYVTDRM